MTAGVPNGKCSSMRASILMMMHVCKHKYACWSVRYLCMCYIKLCHAPVLPILCQYYSQGKAECIHMPNSLLKIELTGTTATTATAAG